MLSPMNTTIQQWVKEIAGLTSPDAVVYCDGSEEERARVVEGLREIIG